MKQTVEEAAREAIYKHYNCNGEYPCGERNYCIYCNGHNAAFDCRECGADEFKEEFIAGAEWQAKQSPWISVEDELPPCSDEDLFLLGIDSRGVANIPDVGYMHYAQDNKPRKDLFVCGELVEVTHWMPIPSFDEIIKANKDVLQRLKNR